MLSMGMAEGRRKRRGADFADTCGDGRCIPSIVLISHVDTFTKYL